MVLDLLSKYGGPVPRYTSYPTAPHFHDGIGAETYRRWLGDLDPGAPVSLYLHIPFCDTLCWFCGCHTQVVRRQQPIDAYVAALEREIGLVAATIPAATRVVHVHFGGGSPSILTVAQVRRLADALHRGFDFAADAEIAVEIDPRDFERSALDAWVAAGLSRASLGVQDFDPEVQAAINRMQSREETARLIDWLRDAGVRSVNIDLLYGLPHQTVERLLATLDAVIAMAPDRVALFGYAHVPWMKRHQALIDDKALPGPAERLRQSAAAEVRLRAAGYRPIGLDHFACADDSLARASEQGRLSRNFQGYTTDTAITLIGLGASAIGTLPQGYVQNEVAVRGYQQRLARGELATSRGFQLGADDRLRRDVIMRLMCGLEADLPALAARHQMSSAADFTREFAALDQMASDGLVRRDGATVAVTEAGKPFVRAVAALFDRYFQEGAARHSRAI